MNKNIQVVGEWLDEYGITLVNFRDPEDNSEVPAVDADQLLKLILQLEDKMATQAMVARNEGAIAVAMGNLNRQEREVKKSFGYGWWKK